MSGTIGPVVEVDDRDQCLLSDQELLELVEPDVCGFMHKKSSVTGWYRYWFSLKGSRFFFYERERGNRRGILMGEIGLFCCSVSVAASPKRPLELDIVDSAGKLHVLRAASDSELRWWLQAITKARHTTPPGKPILARKADPLAPIPLDRHVKVDNLMFVVHGLGSEIDHFSKDKYLEIMNKVFPDVAMETEFLVIHWRDKLRDLEVQKALLRVVPRVEEKNPMRSFLVEKGSDLMYYGIEKYRRFMLREVCVQMNTKYKVFKERFPDFEGQISICAHSLGSVLCYELLARKLTDDATILKQEGLFLEFSADHMFCVGSPLAQFAFVNDQLRPTLRRFLYKKGADVKDLDFPVVYNIFHAHDPIALRLEPLVGLDLEEIAPLPVPYWKTMSRRESTVRWLGSILGRKDKRKVHRDSAQFYEEFAIPNPRIDLALQVTTTMEEMSTVYSALKAHVDYWQSRDLMLLIISKLLKAKLAAMQRSESDESPPIRASAGHDPAKESPPTNCQSLNPVIDPIYPEIEPVVNDFVAQIVTYAAKSASSVNGALRNSRSRESARPELATPTAQSKVRRGSSADLSWMEFIFGSE